MAVCARCGCKIGVNFAPSEALASDRLGFEHASVSTLLTCELVFNWETNDKVHLPASVSTFNFRPPLYSGSSHTDDMANGS